jgi:hypothetical protein
MVPKKTLAQDFENVQQPVTPKKKKTKPKWRKTLARFYPYIYMALGALIYHIVLKLLDKTTMSGQAFKYFFRGVVLDKSYIIILIVLVWISVNLLYKEYTARKRRWKQVILYTSFVIGLSAITTGVSFAVGTKPEADLLYYLFKNEYNTDVVTVTGVTRGDGVTRPQITISTAENKQLEDWVSGKDFTIRQGNKYKVNTLPRTGKILSVERVDD